MGPKRVGLGRPKGTGKYKEPTKPIRVPTRLIPTLEEFLLHKKEAGQWYQADFQARGIPLYGARIAAGIPHLSDDFIEEYVNFNRYLIPRPLNTFCVRVRGDSMSGAGIDENDILIVDQSLKAVDGAIVVAALDAELTVKRLCLKSQKIELLPENPRYQAIQIRHGTNFNILGVAIHVIHSF
jgi:DNA polymerase V